MYYKYLNIIVNTENLITTSGISGTVPIITQFILSQIENGKQDDIANKNLNKTI